MAPHAIIFYIHQWGVTLRAWRARTVSASKQKSFPSKSSHSILLFPVVIQEKCFHHWLYVKYFINCEALSDIFCCLVSTDAAKVWKSTFGWTRQICSIHVANCTWVMWYLPWPASSPTSSLTASYYLIYCGLDDDGVLAAHTCTRAQTRTYQLDSWCFQKMVSRPFVFFFFSPSSWGTKTETHVVSHRSVSWWSVRKDSVLCWRQAADSFYDQHRAAHSGQGYEKAHLYWQSLARKLLVLLCVWRSVTFRDFFAISAPVQSNS